MRYSGEITPVQVQVFSNPKSGSYDPARLAKLIDCLQTGGAAVSEHHSENGPPCIAPDTTHICVSGGDGTVRHVAMAMLDSGADVPLAIHPAGTVNLLARESGFPLDPGRLSERILQADAIHHHYPVQVDDTLFFACASAGPDSYAVAGLSPRLKRWIGRLAYAVSFARVLANWPRPKITLRFPDRELQCEAFFVAKGRYYAGPWSFAPDARIDEPVMHVVSLTRARRRDFALFAWDMLRRRDPSKRAGVTCTVTDRVDIRCDTPVPLQADGDIIGELPTRLAVSSKPVRVC